MSEFKEAFKDFKEEVFQLFKNKEKEAEESTEIKLGSVTAQDGIVFEYEGETPTEGAAIWVNAEDGTKVPVPVGDYTLEDGSILVVQEEGVISSVGEAEKEEAEAELESEAPGTDGNDIVKQVQESIKSIMIKYNEEQGKKLDEIKAEFEKQIFELKQQPAAKKIKSTVEQVALNNSGRLLEKLRNNKN